MAKLIALRGISGSGKSSYAETMRAQGYSIVSRDSIRGTVFKDYADVDEDAVTKIEDCMVETLLKAGRNVCVDDCNIRAKYLKRFHGIAMRLGAGFDVKQFDVPLSVAVNRVSARAAAGGRDVPSLVIQKQFQSLRSLPLAKVDYGMGSSSPYVPDESKPQAIIVDIDGTLAHNDGHRSFYDYSRVRDDKLHHHVRETVRAMHAAGYKIIVCTGREATDDGLNNTVGWLNDHDVPYSALFMRAEGDQRNDGVVKLELFDQNIRDNFNVAFCLDDRNRVVDAWRSIGLPTYQVAPGDF